MPLLLIMPLVIGILFSYYEQKQFQHPKLQHDVYSLSEKDNSLFQLNDGWRYAKQHDLANVQLLPSMPTTIRTNEVTTLLLSLQIPNNRQIYSLDLKGIQQPFELWINDELVHVSPKLAHNKLIHFYAEDNVVELKVVITPINGRIALLQTPVIGETSTMQGFIFKQFVIVLMALLCLSILGVYYVTIYIAKREQMIYLFIGLYFLLVSSCLFFADDGFGLLFLDFPLTIMYKLKTISGLLAAVPLYFIVILLNRRLISKAKSLFIGSVIFLTICAVLLLPYEVFLPVELIIWIALTLVLVVQLIKVTIFIMKTKAYELKNILLLNTLFYVVTYLALRVYYNIWGTDIQTSIWLSIFVISMSMYMTLHQKHLVKELEHSKIDAIQSKISFFNAQIKPHFLYNALSNIIALCYTDNVKAAHLLGKFSTYLRIIFENNMQSDWISLEKELTLIDAYVEIEQARFPGKIQYVLEVPEYIKSYKIPTLTIQPFVENAIRHGLFNKDELGTVYVSIEKQHEKLVIVIKDDGIGMAEEQLAHIMKGQYAHQGIGITNVIQRLHFIKNSQFDIKSAVNEGTYIRFTLPIHYESEGEHDC